MFHKDKIYKKKLRIDHMLQSNTLSFQNSRIKTSQNPEAESSYLDAQKELKDTCNLTFSKIKSSTKKFNLAKEATYPKNQSEHNRTIYKQINSLGNLFSQSPQCKKHQILEKFQAIDKMQGFLIDPLRKNKKKNKNFQGKSIQAKFLKDLKHPKRYSSLNQSSQNLSFRNMLGKEKFTTHRNQETSPTHQNYKLFKKKQFSTAIYDHMNLTRQESSAKSLTKVTSILNLKPKDDKKGKKGIKMTAMGKYDLGYENIRLASKILSMKPTKFCDIKEQKKFYKKQSYFKEIRSRTIEMNEQAHLNEICHSISFPKINERYRTTEQ